MSDRPSPALLEALVSLISDAHRLGISRSQLYEKGVFRSGLSQFTTECLALIDLSSLRRSKSASQLLWDILFLDALCKEVDANSSTHETIIKVQEQVRSLISSSPSAIRSSLGHHPYGRKVCSKTRFGYQRVGHQKHSSVPTIVVTSHPTSHLDRFLITVTEA
jgi:hypothetical protein